MSEVTVLILTYNERVHIERCVRSAQQFARQIFIVDSGSDDGTVELAKSLGAEVFHHAWENNHARQVNWAIDNLPIESEWVMRLDADEIVPAALAEEIRNVLPTLPASVNGIVLKRQQIFMGHALRWGGTYPICLLRIWRRGRGHCEDRWMDEHMVVAGGETRELAADLQDHNINDLRWWTSKEANYAVREAADTLIAQTTGGEGGTAPQDPRSRRKRRLKILLYRRVPPFARPGAYFVYRYFFRLGFLDGIPGLMWHVLQGFWYRFLVDSIIEDIQRRARDSGTSALDVIESTYGLRLGQP